MVSLHAFPFPALAYQPLTHPRNKKKVQRISTPFLFRTSHFFLFFFFFFVFLFSRSSSSISTLSFIPSEYRIPWQATAEVFTRKSFCENRTAGSSKVWSTSIAARSSPRKPELPLKRRSDPQSLGQGPFQQSRSCRECRQQSNPPLLMSLRRNRSSSAICCVSVPCSVCLVYLLQLNLFYADLLCFHRSSWRGFEYVRVCTLEKIAYTHTHIYVSRETVTDHGLYALSLKGHDAGTGNSIPDP